MQPAAASTTTSSTTRRGSPEAGTLADRGFRVLVEDGRYAVLGDGDTAVVKHIGTTVAHQKVRIGMVLACPPDLAGQTIDTIHQHIENGNSFCRCGFSGQVGASIVGLVPIDAGFDREEPPEIPEAMKEFARSKRPKWEESCGYNVDWRDMYHHSIPEGKQLVSGVELPSPWAGYPNLDVLGTVATMKFKANMHECIYRALQQRAIIECGIAIHIDFIRAGIFTAVGQTVVPASAQPPVDVFFLSINLPEDARMLDLTMDDDMRRRLQSYHTSAPLPEGMAYVAIVPHDFELGAGVDAPGRDQILLRKPNRSLMITCRTCGVAFEHTYADQRWFRERGFEQPKTCKRCKQIRRSYK